MSIKVNTIVFQTALQLENSSMTIVKIQLWQSVCDSSTLDHNKTSMWLVIPRTISSRTLNNNNLQKLLNKNTSASPQVKDHPKKNREVYKNRNARVQEAYKTPLISPKREESRTNPIEKVFRIWISVRLNTATTRSIGPEGWKVIEKYQEHKIENW